MKIKFFINLLKIKEENNIHLYEKMKEINDSNSNIFEIKKMILKEEKSTTINIPYNLNLSLIKIKNEELNYSEMNSYSNSYNSYIINYLSHSNNSLTNSTFCDTKIDMEMDINNSFKERKFNPLRINFYLENNLYDILLSHEILNYNHPPKYKINDELFAFLYPNIPKTYCIAISGFISNNKILNYDSKNLEVKNNNSQYNIIYGLYFCEKEEQIKIGDKIEYKICKPNEFICKQCMDLNKQKYNLKKSYLININGRVSKINKGSYHCFGNFLEKNIIEQCINKFSCIGCKNLNNYSEYYI